ncbi:UNKNOWN [Stylonychia lemnae]|uniref:Transmembrane protein n=1 Tax=Stylonychia lemnae TaxID=5949 RepID=A0A078A842_STYLE|nr:UNKNOWN [Stylonychia lemnae]|eukprot:CDW78425.1 UNKNOWN [Stylonychia lemnae]
MIQNLYLIVKNSQFINSSASENGGSIFSNDANVQIYNSTFKNGLSNQSGGSIYLQCQLSSGCDYVIQNNSFINNSAKFKGGAILYDLNRPFDLKENLYYNNSAKYGQNIASYPYQIKILNQDLDFLKSITSDEFLSNKLLIALVDQDDQIVDDDNQKSIQISSHDDDLSLSGITSLTSNNGIFEINQLKIIGEPSNSYKIQLSSSSIDQTKIDFKTNGLSADFMLDIKIRDCKQGEIKSEKKCYECPKGSYSLSTKDKICQACPQNIKCDGGARIILEPNYWRSNTNTTQIYKCPKNEVCLGGYDSACQTGYHGKLCTQCIQDSQDDYYARSGLYDCSKCLSFSNQVTILVAILGGLATYIVYILQTSIILFGYLCYPIISQNSFSLLSCITFEDAMEKKRKIVNQQNDD